MKFKLKFDIKREVKIVAVLVTLGGIIAFTEARQSHVSVRDVSVKMVNVSENHFLDEDDIMGLMDLKKDNIKGASLSEVNMREYETKIRREPFVEDAQLYSDLKGNLMVKTSLRRPIARIVRGDGPDGYIAEDGTVMPVSSKFTSRVILVSGSYVNTLLKQRNLNLSEDGKNLLTLINKIREDEFWNAQIAQLDIDNKTRVTILPQVGDEQIEFGKPEDLDTKFSKLMIFYKEILPRMGWNKYSRVNLEYEGQIVAE
ncbi:MAG: cell division protein FtsQ [Chryseolinea sp.]